MGRVLGLLVVAVIVLLSYKFYFSHLQQTAGTGSPVQVISEVGAKNDLININRAEVSYNLEHHAYATFDQLVSSGLISMTRSGRDGYTYEIEASESEYRATARCTVAGSNCTSWMVDQTSQVRPAQ
jgi:hypothetical protein